MMYKLDIDMVHYMVSANVLQSATYFIAAKGKMIHNSYKSNVFFHIPNE